MRNHNLCHGLLQVTIVLLISGVTPFGLVGQQSDTIGASSRIRVDFATGERSIFRRSDAQSVVGTVSSLVGDTVALTIRSDAAPVLIPRSAIRELYLSKGRMTRWEAGWRGAIGPAAIGAVISLAASSVRRKAGDPSPAQSALSSALWGGLTGAALGVWSPPERWRRLAIDQRACSDRAYCAGVSP